MMPYLTTHFETLLPFTAMAAKPGWQWKMRGKQWQSSPMHTRPRYFYQWRYRSKQYRDQRFRERPRLQTYHYLPARTPCYFTYGRTPGKTGKTKPELCKGFENGHIDMADLENLPGNQYSENAGNTNACQQRNR